MQREVHRHRTGVRSQGVGGRRSHGSIGRTIRLLTRPSKWAVAHSAGHSRNLKKFIFTIVTALALFVLAACNSQSDTVDQQARWDRIVAEAAECWEASNYGGTGMSDTTVTKEYAQQVIEKYLDVILRQPNFVLVGAYHLEDDEGNRTEVVGIRIGVTEKVDQSTLPEADQIPDCLDGVSVRFHVQAKIQRLKGG